MMAGHRRTLGGRPSVSVVRAGGNYDEDAGVTVEQDPGAVRAEELATAYEIKTVMNKAMRDAISIAMRTTPGRRLDLARVDAVPIVLIGMLEKERAKLIVGDDAED